MFFGDEMKINARCLATKFAISKEYKYSTL